MHRPQKLLPLLRAAFYLSVCGGAAKTPHLDKLAENYLSLKR